MVSLPLLGAIRFVNLHRLGTAQRNPLTLKSAYPPGFDPGAERGSAKSGLGLTVFADPPCLCIILQGNQT